MTYVKTQSNLKKAFPCMHQCYSLAVRTITLQQSQDVTITSARQIFILYTDEQNSHYCYVQT
jgi:hypothetical protein